MRKGKDGIYEHQRWNFNVLRVRNNGIWQHCYARNQDKWFPCKRQEWGAVADDLVPGVWYLALMQYKPASARDDTSFNVIKVRDIEPLRVDPAHFNRMLWEWANERYDNDWSPRDDPRFMRMVYWMMNQELPQEEYTRIIETIEGRLGTMKDPILPSTRDFFIEMLNTKRTTK